MSLQLQIIRRWYACLFDPTKAEFILNNLNTYHPNINFTFELEKNNEINFLDALIKRLNNNKLETGVNQKPTSTNIYLNWNGHAPTEWKIRTLRNLIKRAKPICSEESLVNEEMKYLKKVFHEVNNYSMSVINKLHKKSLMIVKVKIGKQKPIKLPIGFLPYSGK